jgi:hypothetical protein
VPVLRVKGHKKIGPRSGLARGAAKFSLEMYYLFLGRLYSAFLIFMLSFDACIFRVHFEIYEGYTKQLNKAISAQS